MLMLKKAGILLLIIFLGAGAIFITFGYAQRKKELVVHSSYGLKNTIIKVTKAEDLIDRLLQNTNFSHFSICKSLKLRNPIFKKLSFVTALRVGYYFFECDYWMKQLASGYITSPIKNFRRYCDCRISKILTKERNYLNGAERFWFSPNKSMFIVSPQENVMVLGNSKVILKTAAMPQKSSNYNNNCISSKIKKAHVP